MRNLLSFTISAIVLAAGSATAIAGGPDYPPLGAQLGEFNISLGARDPVCMYATACFSKGKVEVIGIEGAVSRIKLNWTASDAPQSADESRSRIKKFLPRDAQWQRTYTSKSGSLVDVYFSKSLAKHIPSKTPLQKLDGTVAGYLDTWGEAKPGTFIMLHSPQHMTLIAVGNNP